ncbi:MAG: DUF423 domain-containing protein [Leptolyngbyaceae cyanobacterium SL_1_1]|nr:DUF423 domain-containing protein [Leptolyngbyaceae cyanobacterium RM1_1_2]NJO11876.1 DUF423 domain-containing protein [Leptolyngbyaceae cyanobacterium SL_1_1]
MARVFLGLAAILAGLAVAGGAFGAHALKDHLTARSLEIFETGVRYQMYHALGLLAIAILLLQQPAANGLLTVAGWGFVGGVLIFSGSLYGLSLSGIKWLGAITPLGGVAFLVGWVCLASAALSVKQP